MSLKPMQLGSPNLTYKCSMITHGNPFIFRSEGQIRESKQHCRGGSLHSCECWLLLVVMIICLICLFLLCLLTEDGQAELTWLTEYVQRWFSHTLCVYVCGYFYLILFRLFIRRQFWMKVHLILKTVTKMLRCWNFFRIVRHRGELNTIGHPLRNYWHHTGGFMTIDNCGLST